MQILLAVTATLFLVAAFAAGAYAGRRSTRSGLLAGGVGLAFVLLRVLAKHFPEQEFALLDYDWYASVRPWCYLPPALLVLGAGLYRVRPLLRIAVEVLAGVLVVLFVYGTHATLTHDLRLLEGTVAADGVCLQSTDYSCGAAAAATLLAQYGITATEREMAIACGTSPVSGTDEFAVLRGLRAKLPAGSLRPALRSLTWDDLDGATLPCMAVMRLTAVIDHWVVVLRREPSAVVVADPLHGLQTLPRERFLARSRGVGVVLEPARE